MASQPAVFTALLLGDVLSKAFLNIIKKNIKNIQKILVFDMSTR